MPLKHPDAVQAFALTFVAILLGCVLAAVTDSCIHEHVGPTRTLMVQVGKFTGRVIRCFEIDGEVNIAFGTARWTDTQGHYNTIAGTFIRTEFTDDDWDKAYARVGVTKEQCKQ